MQLVALRRKALFLIYHSRHTNV